LRVVKYTSGAAVQVPFKIYNEKSNAPYYSLTILFVMRSVVNPVESSHKNPGPNGEAGISLPDLSDSLEMLCCQYAKQYRCS